MDQLVNVLLVMHKGHTTLQIALDCRPGKDGLHQVYGPNHPTPCS